MDALRGVVKDMLAEPAVTKRLAGFLSGLDLRYAWGEGHPLVGRRMPNLALDEGDVFAHLHAGRPVLFVFDGVSRVVSERITVVHTRVTEGWRLPVVGEVAPVAAALVRPDGYVAWVTTTGNDEGLSAASARWVG